MGTPTRATADRLASLMTFTLDHKERSDAIDAVLQHREQEVREEERESKWLPIGTPPENDNDVLVLFEDDGIDIGYWRNDVKALDSNNSGWLNGVTHWMPLPAAIRRDSAQEGEGG